MTDQELRDLVARIAINQERMQIETEQRRAADEQRRAAEKAADEQRRADSFAKEKKRLKKSELEQKNLRQQIGDMHRKWGTFTEALLMPSIEKLLYTKFSIGVTTANHKSRKNGEEIELDAFGYVNSDINTAVIVEVKSHLRQESITQMLTTMERFSYFWPDHADKKLYGIMACVSAPENLRQELRKHGIYLAIIDDVLLKLKDPKNFVPTDFNHKSIN
jgi:hypothetical protein